MSNLRGFGAQHLSGCLLTMVEDTRQSETVSAEMRYCVLVPYRGMRLVQP